MVAPTLSLPVYESTGPTCLLSLAVVNGPMTNWRLQTTFKDFIFISNCVFKFVSMGGYVPEGGLWRPNIAWDPLYLELYAALMCMLGIELGSSAKAVCAFNHSAVSTALGVSLMYEFPLLWIAVGFPAHMVGLLLIIWRFHMKSYCVYMNRIPNRVRLTFFSSVLTRLATLIIATLLSKVTPWFTFAFLWWGFTSCPSCFTGEIE